MTSNISIKGPAEIFGQEKEGPRIMWCDEEDEVNGTKQSIESKKDVKSNEWKIENIQKPTPTKSVDKKSIDEKSAIYLSKLIKERDSIANELAKYGKPTHTKEDINKSYAQIKTRMIEYLQQYQNL